METIYLEDFLDEGLLRESSFREKVDRINWSKYSNKRVMIKGCTDIPIPTWAYWNILTNQSGPLSPGMRILLKDLHPENH